MRLPGPRFSETTGNRRSPHEHQWHFDHRCVYDLNDHSLRDPRSARRCAARLTSLREGLDKNMHKALQVKKHPDILFRLAPLRAAFGSGRWMIRAQFGHVSPAMM